MAAMSGGGVSGNCAANERVEGGIHMSRTGMCTRVRVSQRTGQMKAWREVRGIEEALCLVNNTWMDEWMWKLMI